MKTHSLASSGFTLVELVLAIGVAVFAMVPILGLLSSAAKTDANAGQDTTLAAMSNYVMTEMRAVPFDALWASDPTTVSNPQPSTATPQNSIYYFTNEGAPVTAANAPSSFDVAYMCTVIKTPDSLTQNMDSGNFNRLTLQLQFRWPVNSGTPVQNGSTRSIYVTIARH